MLMQCTKWNISKHPPLLQPLLQIVNGPVNVGLSIPVNSAPSAVALRAGYAVAAVSTKASSSLNAVQRNPQQSRCTSVTSVAGNQKIPRIHLNSVQNAAIVLPMKILNKIMPLTRKVRGAFYTISSCFPVFSKINAANSDGVPPDMFRLS